MPMVMLGLSWFLKPRRQTSAGYGSNSEKGGLNRQAGLPRVTFWFSTTRNPAIIRFNCPTRGG